MEKKFSHLNSKGEARMVDVSGKEPGPRRAIAIGFVKMKPETVEAIRDERLPKGDIFAAARIAGILAAKRTAELIPLCHPLNIDYCEIGFDMEDDGVSIRAEVKVARSTGVEMEAITAVSVSAMTIYDMAKSVDKDMVIGGIMLIEKDGGKSGPYRRLSQSNEE